MDRKHPVATLVNNLGDVSELDNFYDINYIVRVYMPLYKILLRKR